MTPYRDNVSEQSNTYDDEDDDDIRLKAFNLLNKIGPDDDDDESSWPQKPLPKKQLSSYQNSSHNHPGRNNNANRSAIQTNPAIKDQYEELGLAGLLVSCIADACRKSTEYATRKGYESLVPDARTAMGEFEKVDILDTYAFASNKHQPSPLTGRSSHKYKTNLTCW